MIEQGEKLLILEREFEDDPIKQKEDEEFTKSELSCLTKKNPFPREAESSEEDIDDQKPPQRFTRKDPKQQALDLQEILIQNQSQVPSEDIGSGAFKSFQNFNLGANSSAQLNEENFVLPEEDIHQDLLCSSDLD
jgi:hypothetical protein